MVGEQVLKEDCVADKWKAMSDEEVVHAAQTQKDAVTELILRYRRLIWIKANSMANSAVDADDLMQEGLLGLLRAISSFSPEREIKFLTFADVCISNRMKTLLIRSNRVALPVEDTEQVALTDQEMELENPESILMQKERVEELFVEMKSVLSKREYEIFGLFLCGMRYEQMAQKLQITEKSVDNALQRVRRKLKSAWLTDRVRGS